MISHSPVILLRNSSGRIWQDELTTILEKIDAGFSIPETIRLLTTDGEASESSAQEVDREAWKAVGEDLLFPFPANFEQKLIAQKLATNPGVVVQGPPGTGKSHTIVNLVSHLLAHGKRVLVTSEKERALQVLRDKIPEEIRALCVSLLGGDSKSIKELEDSIKHIAENLDRLQPDVLTSQIERRKQELYETRKTMARIQMEINKAAELENESLSVDGDAMTPLEIGRWLSDHISHNWLPDRIPLVKEFPLSESDLRTLFHLLGTLRHEDMEQLDMARTLTTEIPSPSEFKERISQIKWMEEKVEDADFPCHCDSDHYFVQSHFQGSPLQGFGCRHILRWRNK